ncbi:MAG: NAD-dependent epimerase/dehydratase family protein [Pseudomonadota bacterium]
MTTRPPHNGRSPEKGSSQADTHTLSSDAEQPIEAVLVTGAAGFIGAAVSARLLKAGVAVIGVDNVNDYYSPTLKRARLAPLLANDAFQFHEVNIADRERLFPLFDNVKVDGIVHLAAQAGVRYSLSAPFAYSDSNLTGHLTVLELARRLGNIKTVYASSSSVYGANTKTPFSETDPVEKPVSLYAATKRSCELMSESYARLYDLPLIGLRFFTVYGPAGRPDMAYWLFAERMLAGEEIRVFNHGDLERDFTYIDDIVSGVVSTIMRPMNIQGDARHRIYNIGNNRPVRLMRFIEILEEALGVKAKMEMLPMQPGDVFRTAADITAISEDYGFAPTTPLEVGIPHFAEWFHDYRRNQSAK